MIIVEQEKRARYTRWSRILAAVSAVLALVYLKWLIFDAIPENMTLYWLLFVAEVFNLGQAAGFWYTISRQEWREPPVPNFSVGTESVDVFITVCGEPSDVVEATLRGALDIRHPRKRVWVLDDGRSSEIEALSRRLGSGYLVRADRRGAKAGNINEALKRTAGDFVLILDADHVPEPEFLEQSMGAFSGPEIAFVQTPQSYANRTTNRVAAGAHEQQALFYGPILRGKQSRNAVFSCGTNVIFRRAALESIGGMPEDSITEDLRVTLMLLRKGYGSAYVPRILAHGMGPVDVKGYFSQQLRWARGGLEILFKRRPFFAKMQAGTAVQFWLSFIYWFTGFAYLIYLVLPTAFLYFGEKPVVSPNAYPIYFLPYVTATIITLVWATNAKITFRALWFTLGSFPMHIWALVMAIVGRRARFVVTSKTRSKTSLRPVFPHIVAIAVLGIGCAYAIVTQGFTPPVMNNVAFALGHILILQGFIRYAIDPEFSAEEIRAFEREERSRRTEAAPAVAEGDVA